MRLNPALLLAAALLAIPAAASAATEPPPGQWRAATIAGKPVAKDVKSEIEIAADGKIAGTGGCNRLMGQAKISGKSISFGSLAGTMMMCPDEAMAQERAFQEALKATQRFTLKSGGKTLVLKNKAGKATAVLVRE